MPNTDHQDSSEFHPPVAYLSQKAAERRTVQEHGGPMETVCEATDRGHRIVVRTIDEITVDRKPLVSHVEVANNRLVYYHALATYSFPSTIGLVEELIDRFPETFAANHHDVCEEGDDAPLYGATAETRQFQRASRWRGADVLAWRRSELPAGPWRES